MKKSSIYIHHSTENEPPNSEKSGDSEDNILNI